MYRCYIKRFLDFIFALLLSPFILFIALFLSLFVFFDDKGPVFYCARRYGKNGKIYNIIKFRTMKVNSQDLRNEDGSTFSSSSDCRVTKVGRFLRKTSIDELPQVFNVLFGSMSFIGPRPVLTGKSFNELDNKRLKRLEVHPGISGYSQAYFRNSISQEDKIIYDIFYVENCSFVMDIKILFKTISTVIKSENINTNK